MVLLSILYSYRASAQSDNSTNIEEQDPPPYDTIDGIHALFLLIAFIIIWIKIRNPKTKIRGWIALFLVIGSMGLWMIERGGEFPWHTNLSERILAIFLVIFGLIILLVHQPKKSVPWKKYEGIRRHFSGQLRQEVLNVQKYKCANCNMTIAPPLVHYDHLDGNHSNNDISNCQALCPNCHSLKTDDDRKNQ